MTEICLDDDVQTIDGDGNHILDTVESLLRFEVARRASRWTFVHAGVVGWQGRAILVPGQSLSGKSTLVRALVNAGAAYYSDEYAVLDRKGLVYPFAQPLMHRVGDGTRARVSIEDLGVTRASGPLKAGLVVATRFSPDATWNPRALAPGEIILALLANTVRAQTAPAEVLRVLARVAEHSSGIESVRGEAVDTAAALLDRSIV